MNDSPSIMDLSDEVLVQVFSYLKQLVDLLSLSKVCSRFQRLVQDKKVVHRLSFRRDLCLGYDALTKFLRSRSCYLHVRHLNLNSVYWLSSQNLKFLLKLKQLVTLHVADTKLAKSDILELLSTNKNLESISISWSPSAELTGVFPNITCLRLHWREEPDDEPRIAGHKVFKVLEKFPELRWLWIYLHQGGDGGECSLGLISPGSILRHLSHVVEVVTCPANGAHDLYTVGQGCDSSPIYLDIRTGSMSVLEMTKPAVITYVSEKWLAKQSAIKCRAIPAKESSRVVATFLHHDVGSTAADTLHLTEELRVHQVLPGQAPVIDLLAVKYSYLRKCCLPVDYFGHMSLDTCRATFAGFVHQIKGSLNSLEIYKISELPNCDPTGERVGELLRQVVNLTELETLAISAPYRVATIPVLPHIVAQCTKLTSLSVKASSSFQVSKDFAEALLVPNKLEEVRFFQRSWIPTNRVIFDALTSCSALKFCVLIDDSKAFHRKTEISKILDFVRSRNLVFLYLETPSIIKSDIKIIKASLKKEKADQPNFVFAVGQDQLSILQEFHIPARFLSSINKIWESAQSPVANIRFEDIF